MIETKRKGTVIMKVRKRFGVFLICAVLAAQIVGCGNSDNSQNNWVRSDSSEVKSELGGINGNFDEPARPTENAGTGNTEEDTDGNRILIAYFTAGENSDVDAVSSASVVTVDGEAKGCLRAVADMIQAETNGTLFSIQTSVKYPGDGGALIEYAAEEQEEGVRPELTSHMDNLEDYDVIFIGYPTWLAYHNLIQCTQA